jgi:hypothetical protein
MDPDSPANVGRLVLDPPAGRHGFVTVKDGHFQFENGTRARFWGTNLASSACFPAKRQAEFLAARLAFFGFNAVRLHSMDMHHVEPHGIIEDSAPIERCQTLFPLCQVSDTILTALCRVSDTILTGQFSLDLGVEYY